MSVRTIQPEELNKILRDGQTIELIDVRTPVEFRELHVEAARNIPLNELDPVAVMESRTDSTAKPLYVICRSGSRGQQACKKFLNLGFSNVVNIDGGTLACVSAGVPIVRGAKVMSLERQVRIAAGSLVLIGLILGWTVNPAFAAISAFVGAGLTFSGITDTCGMALVLARMPWNQCREVSTCSRSGA